MGARNSKLVTYGQLDWQPEWQFLLCVIETEKSFLIVWETPRDKKLTIYVRARPGEGVWGKDGGLDGVRDAVMYDVKDVPVVLLPCPRTRFWWTLVWFPMCSRHKRSYMHPSIVISTPLRRTPKWIRRQKHPFSSPSSLCMCQGMLPMNLVQLISHNQVVRLYSKHSIQPLFSAEKIASRTVHSEFWRMMVKTGDMRNVHCTWVDWPRSHKLSEEIEEKVQDDDRDIVLKYSSL